VVVVVVITEHTGEEGERIDCILISTTTRHFFLILYLNPEYEREHEGI